MDEWVKQCWEGVANELHRRGWTLISGEEMAQRVAQELQSRYAQLEDIPSEEIKRATVRCYCRALYEACGATGTPAQHRAFEELWDYLYPRAIFRLHDASKAQDATQQTLVKIFEKRTTCRNAGSFLRWSELILIREIAEMFRKRSKGRSTEQGIQYEDREIGLEELAGDAMNEETHSSEEFVHDGMQDTLREALTGPMRDALLATLRACLKNERSYAVIVLLFLFDSSFLEVAEQLKLSPQIVQVTKSRALKKLRACGAMEQLFEDWFE